MHTRPTHRQRQNPPHAAGSQTSRAAAFSIAQKDTVKPSETVSPADETRWLAYKTALYPLVLTYATKLVGDQAVAGEVCLLAFRRLWENRGCVSGEQQALAFLFMAARTQATALLRLRDNGLRSH